MGFLSTLLTYRLNIEDFYDYACLCLQKRGWGECEDWGLDFLIDLLCCYWYIVKVSLLNGLLVVVTQLNFPKCSMQDFTVYFYNTLVKFVGNTDGELIT